MIIIENLKNQKNNSAKKENKTQKKHTTIIRLSK